MTITVDSSKYLPVGFPYDPILVMAAIEGAGLLITSNTEISDGTIVNDHIASNTIVANTKISSGTIQADQIASNAITSAKINAAAVSADKIEASAITTTKIAAGAVTTAKIEAEAITSGLIGADAVNATHINVTELSAITAAMGSITSGTITSSTFQTSQDPADNRVKIDGGGVVGYDTTLGTTFTLPTDGSAPRFASGTITSVDITNTTLQSSSFYTSTELPWVEITTGNAVAYKESVSAGKYNSDTYTAIGTYGTGYIAHLFKSDKPILAVLTDRTAYADVGLYNKSADPTGTSSTGDLCCVNGDLRFCSSGGSPGTYKDVLYDTFSANAILLSNVLELNSSSSCATPTLTLDQDDVDEPFIDFDGTSAADQTKNISTVNGDGSVEGPKNFSSSAGWQFEGMVKVEVNGTDYWMPYYSADTS